MIEFGLHRFHDATLLDANLKWDSAACVLHFRAFVKELDAIHLITITAEELKHLVWVHEMPWGESVSINNINGPRSLQDGYQVIDIEMQSGDSIAVEAKRFTVDVGEKA